MRRQVAELGLGVRLALSGNRIRTATAALGIAIGTAALLLAAAVPTMMHDRSARDLARSDSGDQGIPQGNTTAIGTVDSEWNGQGIRGRLLWAEGPDAPVPPGIPAIPGEKQMYVSPALKKELDGPDGKTLLLQMPYRVVGVIGEDGLIGPQELTYYAGYERASELVGTYTHRVDHFGAAEQPSRPNPSVYVMVALLLATVLLPVAIFIGAALRFGSDVRDRRLAAIRLLGADSRGVLRIAVGESLVTAAFGLLLGVAMFLLARAQAGRVQLLEISVYPADVRPVPAYAVAVVAVVVALSAGMTLLGFRKVTVEPLGVFRHSTTWRGRLWWRLIAPAAGLFLIYPAMTGERHISEARAAAGVVVLVVALIPLVPYLVPSVSKVFPAGPASWQIASQQLRLNPTSSTRAVTGIVVAVAGIISLNSVLSAAAVYRTQLAADNGANDPNFSVQITGAQNPAQMRARSARFDRVDPDVHAGTVAMYGLYFSDPDVSGYVVVGDCAALRQLADLGGCTDGDTFRAGDIGRTVTTLKENSDATPEPGGTITVPAATRTVHLFEEAHGDTPAELLLTPGATPAYLPAVTPWFVATSVFVGNGRAGEVDGKLRGVVAAIDPLALYSTTFGSGAGDPYTPIRTGLVLGGAVILALLGLGLLLDVFDRLRERRRLLGVLRAVGARRSTVAWSVLLQAVVPVVTGLALAAAIGAGLGAVLMRMSQIPVTFDAGSVLLPVAGGAALVLACTVAVLLPAIHRVTQTEELRYE